MDRLGEKKVAIVSGASRGIGRAIALKLAKSGYDIAMIAAHDNERAQMTLKEVKAYANQSSFFECNVANPVQVAKTLEEIKARYTDFDVLVNNAGITRDKLLLSLSEEDIASVIDVNLLGTIYMTKACLKTFLRKKSGSIVNISSIVGLTGNVGQANYAASKAGIIGFTKSVAKEYVDSVSDKFDRVENSIKDIMLLYFTSGTSGKPKGVEHDFSYPLAHIVTAKFWHGCKDGGVHFAIADSGWAKSAWGKLYGQWFCECAVVVYDFENFIGHETLALLENFKVTSFCAPPTIYKYLVREKLEDYDLSNLEELVTAGEKMPEAIAQNFEKRTGKHIREGFGQTETVLQLASYTWCPDIKDGLGVASPIYNIDVVDELGNPVPNGEEGELVIRPWIDGQIPIGIFTAYFNDAELYKYVWRQGMYHTNDKVVRDINGVFHYIARADDVIKSSGYRIGPAEVEEVLMKEPSVLECAVTGYPSKNRGQVVKATIVLKPELKYTDIKNVEKEIKKFVQDRVAAYKMPRMIEFVESLPKSTSGKISRELIRRMDLKKLNSI